MSLIVSNSRTPVKNAGSITKGVSSKNNKNVKISQKPNKYGSGFLKIFNFLSLKIDIRTYNRMVL